MLYSSFSPANFGISRFNLKNIIRHMSMNDNIASLDRNFKWITGLPILRAGSSKDQQWLSTKDPTLVSYVGQLGSILYRSREVTQPCGYCSSGTLNRIGGAKEIILNMALCYPCHGLIDPQGGKRLIRSRVVAKNPVSPIVFKLVDYN